MPWWQKSSSSSSSSSPKSTSNSPQKNNNNNNVLKETSNFFRDRRGFHQRSKPRLTRQRNLRHLRDLDVGFETSSNPFIRSGSWTVSSPSPSSANASDLHHRHHSSSLTGTPHPLPLPLPSGDSSSSSLLNHRDSGLLSCSNSGHFPLPSPKEDVRKDDGDENERTDSLIGIGDGIVSSTSAIGSTFANQTAYKGSEHVDKVRVKSPTERGKRVLQGPNDIEVQNSNFWPNFPIKSAPNSGLSSPVLSPRRMSTGDFYPPFGFDQGGGIQVWSAPEFSAPDMLAGNSTYQNSPDKIVSSSDHSPLHSPRAKKRPLNHLTIPSRPASPLHHKLSSDSSSTAWHESNGHATCHPLPLPPGASPIHSPTTASIPQTLIAKSEMSSMTSQWKKGELLGRGTFGSVYVASNRETGALCAMKEVDLIPDDAKSAECIKQLEQEIRVLSRLKHPNIVQYYGSEIVRDHFYIYLEYVHPGSINKYVNKYCGAMTESVVRNFTRHILSGLAYLHSTKTVHRDIKGANLLVDAHGVVKLADFGMAKHLNGHAAHLSMKGSPYWMAPEVIQAVLQNDSNSDDALAIDIWSLGCTIIEMLQGKPPWSEFEGAAAMFKVLRETPPIPKSLSSAGKDFLECCFRRNPAERPTASMLLEHRFLRTCHQAEIPAVAQAISEMRIDMAHSAREMPKYKVDLLLSPGRQITNKGQLPFSNGDTGQHSHLEPSDSTATARLSPRSTLETLASLSPPRSGSDLSSINLGYGNARPFTHPSSPFSPNRSFMSFTNGVDHI